MTGSRAPKPTGRKRGAANTRPRRSRPALVKPTAQDVVIDKDVIEVRWISDRTPEVRPPPAPLAEEVAQNWPGLPLPKKGLTPPISASLPRAYDGAAVQVFTLFGLDPAKFRVALRRINRQYRSSRAFKPVIFTDQPNAAEIRQFGFVHEYFATRIFGGADQIPHFEARFLRLWRKWRGASLIDFSAPGFLAERLEDLDFFIQREEFAEDRYDPRKKRGTPTALVPTDIRALRAEYEATGLADEADTFVLYRILGNDLPPRHEVGQTLKNLRFLLENEPPLDRCEKRWVVNRIVDKDSEAAILALLEAHDQPYIHVPFDLDTYRNVDWDVDSFPDDAFFLRGRYQRMNSYDQLRAEAHSRRLKNNYIIHNNGARNIALRDGRDRAKWVLPWDGNCFLTVAAWAEIVTAVTTQPYLKYFTVPMARTLDNTDLLDPAFQPEADEEPQLLFRRDASEEFDETFYYGRRPKVEMFYRLAIPGVWDGWPDDAWDRPRPTLAAEAGATGSAGWVARLFSGQQRLEADKTGGLRSRGEARISAITQMLDRLDVEAAALVYQPENLTAYDEARITALAAAKPGSPEYRLHARLIQEAELALQRGPYSVMDKAALPPSGDAHDYFHPAPYWWPNPVTPNGIPYVFRDGVRIPGTRLYEPESGDYDRTRLQRLFDDTTVLALAWVAQAEDRFADHAATLIRTWFVDEATRMAPHLLYSQVRSQTMHDHGAKSGLIEMKDLYYFLDAVRLVERAGKLSAADKSAFRDWLRAYLEWLQTSEQGVEERLTANNHGTCFDLQTGAIAAFLGDGALLQSTFRTSRERLLEQFTAEGRQPHEMTRTQTAHYCCFNLQCWINLADLAEACGDSLWHFEGGDGRGLAKALSWLLPHLAQKTWKYQQIEPFDKGRFLPLFFAARNRVSHHGGVHLSEESEARPIFFPHDGIKPFWMLGRSAPSPVDTPSWSGLQSRLTKLELPVFELCKTDGGVRAAATDVRTLDKKLWGGFSAGARQDLETVRDDPESELKEVNRAARSLARWHFVAGDYDKVIANADRMRQLNITTERERTLLKAYCLDHLGQSDEAAALVTSQLALFPKDTDLHLAMANLCGALGQDTALPTGWDWIGWISQCYRNAGLSDAFVRAGAGDTLLELEPTAPGAPSADAPLISVIVPVLSPTPYLRLALQSLRQQSWTNLEILVTCPRSAKKTLAELTTLAQQDPRVRVVEVAANAAEFSARNTALAQATGQYVTVNGATELAHPEKLRAHLDVLRASDAIGVCSQHVELSTTGRVLGGWHPEFTMLSKNPQSLMLEVETLRAHGGWDAVASDPDSFLTWRLKRRGDKPGISPVLFGVPISLTVVEANHPRVTHLEFPYGQRRDDLRRLLRATEAVEADQAEAEALESMPVPPLPGPIARRPARFDAVFLGDFSTKGVAVAAIQPHVVAALQGGGTVGLIHWPDYHATWSDRLAPEIAELLDEGGLHQISGFEPAEVSRLVICNPYVLYQQADGFAALRADRLDILGGPELTAAEFFDGVIRQRPLVDEIAALFGCPARLVTL